MATGEFVIINNRHNHPMEGNGISKMEFKKELREACIREPGNLGNIYERLAARNPDGAVTLPYNSIRSSMLRWRQTTTPNISGSLTEMAETLQSGEWQHYSNFSNGTIFSGIVAVNQDHAIIFGNAEFISNFRTSQTVFMDGTFKAVPRRPTFGQILTIFATCMDHAFPIVHVFMERRTKALYDSVFAYLIETFPQFVNGTIVTDYEVALVDSLHTSYPGATLHGCFFHYCQAVLRKAKTLGILRQIEGNANARILLKKYYALALLPAEAIAPALRSLQDLDVGGIFGPLYDYIQRQWIGRVTPQHFSVFQQRHRTNNTMESYHRRLNSKLVRHPGVWDLMGTLIDVQNTASVELAQLERGQRVFRIAKKNEEFHARLSEAWEKLSNGRFTVSDFMRQAVHFVENLDVQLHAWNANIAEDDEDPNLPLLVPNRPLPLLEPPPLIPIGFAAPPFLPHIPQQFNAPLTSNQVQIPPLNEPPPLVYFHPAAAQRTPTPIPQQNSCSSSIYTRANSHSE